MKQMALIGSVAAALTLIAAPSAFAQSEGQKLQRVERDNRDIRNDTRDIWRDKAEIGSDRARLREERGERYVDLWKEERAIARGNLKAAEKWDARRRQEQKDINVTRRDLHKDEVDLAKDRFDRNKDIAKRNRDASKL